MNSSQSRIQLAFQKYEFAKLCHTLGFKRAEIRKLLESMPTQYKEWTEEKKDKSGNVKKYQDGTPKKRTFRNPSKFLKLVQRRIKKNILDKAELPESAHGGVKKRSNITNAKKHQGKKYIFATDLQEFYPNICGRQVFEVFRNLGYSSHTSHWLTKLTTYNNELPQGSPTSPSLANLVFSSTDRKLMTLCESKGITYTRYVDDLTFSCRSDFSHVIKEIMDTILSDGFKVSHRKTLYKAEQTITGIRVFLNKIDAPDHIIEYAQAELDNFSATTPYLNYLIRIRQTNKK